LELGQNQSDILGLLHAFVPGHSIPLCMNPYRLNYIPVVSCRNKTSLIFKKSSAIRLQCKVSDDVP